MTRLIWLNFHFAVGLAIAGGTVILLRPTLVFPEIGYLYGPLVRNLLLVIFYLVILDALLWALRYRCQGYLEALFMGGVFLIAASGIPLYSRINGIPINLSFIAGLTYCGISHLLYFLLAYRQTSD